MTKYIRTKTEIKKIETTLTNEEVFAYLSQFDNYKDDLIKVADTIEKLCDEFVIKGTRGLYLGIPLQECGLKNIPITQIYGAIWTNKGLIYVAKMNEKGELELL